MATRKKKTASRSAASTKVKRARTSSSMNAGTVASGLGRFGLPLLISAILLVALGVLGVTFYQNATGSEFFRLRSVDVRGNEHTSADDIKRVVMADIEKTGTWNADLAELKAKVEKFPYVKTASVSRVLPASIRVDVTERIPAAIVHLSTANYIVDGEGVLLEKAAANDQSFPFILNGWDEAKTEKAGPDNVARLKLYKKMLEEWKQFDLASRVRQVDLTSVREPVAIIEDSGRSIPITLARDNLGKSLKTAIEAVSGRGAKIKSVDSEGISPIIAYLDIQDLTKP